MNKRRWMISSLTVGLGFLLLHFQNCAMPSELEGYSDSPAFGSSEEVRIVDDWATAKISLFQKSMDLAVDEDILVVDGFCSRSLRGEVLEWDLEEHSQGVALCEMGGFRLVLDHLGELDCGFDYRLQVRSTEGDQEDLILHRHCL